ncbi:MAG: lamin tail domain-containing protein [Bacteroidales bacterium]|nr:lamin tail domain-containing protein [Bacteroidales bacterium]
MRKIFFILLLILPLFGFSQLSDNFEDGDISGWSESTVGHFASTTNTPLNGSYSMQHDYFTTVTANYQDITSIPIGSLNVASGITTWQFQVKYQNSTPSGTNKWNVFLMADQNYTQMSSGSINGYVIGVNFGSTTDDILTLKKVTNGTGSTIVSSSYTWVTTTQVGIQITRTGAGDWELFMDTDGGFDNLVSIGTGSDATFQTASFFGLVFDFTKTYCQKLWIDDVSIVGAAGNDDNSQVLIGDDAEPATISSLVNSANGIEVFDVKLQDIGGDGFASIINSLTFSQGDNNDVADWTDAIAGAKLFGSDIPSGISGTITSTGISFSQTSMISVNNATTENYQLYIWLKNDLSAVNDNDNLEFKLDFNDIVCDFSGSSFGSGVVESGNTNNAIDIEATKLTFLGVPSAVGQNQDFTLTVLATDANGNVDLDNTNSVTLSKNTGTGTLSSVSGLTKSLVSGEKTWPDLQYSALDNFTISATSTGLTGITSGSIICSEFVYFLNDNFEDGDILGWSESDAGRWAASDFAPINGVYSAHVVYETSVTANYSDKISHSMAGVDLTADSTIWMFNVKFTNPSPSGTNSWYVFLMSDQDKSQMFPGGTINGYVFGLNFSGTDDILKLWKVTNGSASEVISTVFDWNNFDASVPKSVIVSRSTSGDWEIRIDEDGGFDNLVSYGTGSDNSFLDASYFGMVYNYTKTNSLKFWIDDIYVGPPIPDTDAPYITDVEVLSSNSVQLTFNEDVEESTAETVTNYTVDNSIGNPNTAVRSATNHRVVDLSFGDDFIEGTTYGMLVENIEDIVGNVLLDEVVNFEWQNIDIMSVRFVSTTELDVKFTKNVDSATAVQLTNYSVNNSIGNPVSVVYDGVEKDIVHLTFGSSFQYEQNYTLHVINVEDLYGNSISPTDYDFVFYMVRRYDVVINEVMVDINPDPVALPANKYIEIYNVSNYDIDMTDWSLKIGSNTELIFPQLILDAHSYAIVCNGDVASSFSPYGLVVPILTESYLTSTTGKQITIKDTEGEIIEQVFYDPENWYNDPDKDDGGWSMERIDPTNFCNQNRNWRASENYTGGTPGMINSVYGSNPDDESPFIEDVSLVTSCDIIIDFSETVDTVQATSIINYILNTNTIPFEAKIDYDDNSIVHLYFLDHFLFSNNSLVVSNVSDYCGNVMSDTTISFFYELIHATDVEPKSATQIKVYFSEPVDKYSSVNLFNYSVDNGIGNPIVATRDANDSSVVHLLFDTEFSEDVQNLLTINGVSDVNGNEMIESSLYFTYHITQPFDIVVNELMLDINPVPLGLPEAQYLELFNTTPYDIWLSDWVFLAESQTERIFPTVKIESNGFAIVCNELKEDLFTDFGKTVPILGSSDLTQSGKELEIFDNRSNLIYHVRYSDAWYNDPDKDNGGWALEKIDPFNFCESGFNWAASVDISGGTPGRDNSVYKANPDTVGIKLVKVIVKSSNQILVQFSKSLSFETGFDVTNYNVAGIGNPILVNLVDTSYSTVNLYFDTQFTDKQEYTLTVDGVSDDCGNIVSGSSLNFTYYLIHPEYVWVLNQNQLQVKFSEEVDYATGITKDNYVVNNQIGTPNYIVRGTSDPSIVFLQFSTNFTDGVAYEIAIENIQDVNGNVMEPAVLDFIFYKAKVNDIVINEVLYNPYTGGVDFVELYNRSIYPINMLDLRIAKRDETGELASPYRISNYNFLLQPQEYLVITTDTNNIQDTYTYGGKFIELSSMPSYPDDAGTVVIYDEKDTIIDEFTYSQDMQFGLISDYSGISLERIDYNMPAQDTSNWHSAAESVGFATPGLQNSQYKSIDSVYSGTIVLDPQVFSPDNDGYNDQLYINYQFETGGYAATVLIFDKNGRQVRELVNDELIGTSGFWIWDGLDDYDQKVRVGMYIVYVKVFDLEGNIEIYKKSAVVAAMKN